MSPGDFSAAFQNQLAAPFSPMPSAHDIAAEIVRRDHSRIRWLAVLCLLLWIVGAAGMGLLVYGLNQFVMGVRLNNTREFLELKSQQTDQPATADKAHDDLASLNLNARSSPPQQTSDTQFQPSGDSSLAQKVDQAHARMLSDGTDLFHHALPYIDAALVCLFLAALCTVWLVFASRRTTLNRINISLAQISEQLRQLAKPTG
ncbi:MAG TPA: hypothetical protein VMJ32_09905 [Pirellulales bacterium]|nr:hypothetical protein [Pirellulales bacterium]